MDAKRHPRARRPHFNHVHWGFTAPTPLPELYDQAAPMPTGARAVRNRTGQAEMIVTAAQVNRVQAARARRRMLTVAAIVLAAAGVAVAYTSQPWTGGHLLLAPALVVAAGELAFRAWWPR
ncbi:hypothetical protein [Oerskovia jenensis]|uniref:hypothetical protein n=1 Tax=Oerskovia jenensis TaxID=162169 RepID=UPI0036DD4069